MAEKENARTPEEVRRFSLCSGSPTWTRTRDLRINSPSLYRLSYQGTDQDYRTIFWVFSRRNVRTAHFFYGDPSERSLICSSLCKRELDDVYSSAMGCPVRRRCAPAYAASTHS